MRISTHLAAHLTYCLNVHAGETWAENLEAMRTHAAAVRAAVCPDRPFGLGLRLGHEAAGQLENERELVAFRAFLARERFYAFTINGFPYGRFHGAPVKQQVYAPDWRAPERLEYTLRLARILAGVLPEGVSGSISTVPLSYKAWIESPAGLESAAANLAELAAQLAELRDRTGREIHVGLEPEPDCAIENTPEAIAFFERALDPAARRRLGARAAAVRRHVGVCLDTCHMALQFEDPADSLRDLVRAGIRISKVQLSAALAAAGGAVARRELGRFCDPVYLHQVRVRADAGRVEARPDLAPALADAGLDPAGTREWRVHFHVPLYFVEDAGIRSTAGLVTPAFLAQALAAGIEHFEIETYTFGVLPEALRARGVDGSFAEEFRWVLARWPGPGVAAGSPGAGRDSSR